MSLTALLGAIQIGLIFGLVDLGVFLSFRVLNFPDLTVDGSFPLGAAVTASLIVHGVDPFLATAIAILAGAAAGLVTAFLNLRFGILHLLASILTMIALYSINLRIMGRPNIGVLNEWTIMSPFAGHGLEKKYLEILVAGAVLVSCFVSLTLTPVLSVKLTRSHHEHSWFYRVTEPFFAGMENGYSRMLAAFMRVRWVAFVIILACIGSFLIIGMNLQTELAPMEDRLTRL